ncbi:MAG: HD-GYP domain-containing protein [Chloroflexi bacterium]|nr:HD-GYP domain-containing protein [Chloroflexota bacterium]
MAVLLPPPLAATAAAVAKLTGELMVRSQRGTYPSIIATQVARYAVVILLGSLTAHLPGGGALFALSTVGAAAVLWAGDILSAPLLIAPISGERPVHIIAVLLRELGVAEGVQYFIGLLAALAAQQEIWALVLLAVPTAFVYFTFKRAKELDDGTRQLLETMADAVDLRDPHTGGHSRRVTELVAGILRQLGKSGPEVTLIVSAARVHDIGKIGIPDHVLHKTGKLAPDEWELMRMHPEQGADLMQRYPSFARGTAIVRHHHERWDGQGYPHGLKGTDIPFGARVIAVADSFDAMTSDRPYRRGMSPREAARILREGRGTQWDAAIVDAFLRSMADRLDQPAASHLRIVPSRSLASSR